MAKRPKALTPKAPSQERAILKAPLRVFSDRTLLRENKPCIPMLHPFWNMHDAAGIESRRYDAYHGIAHTLFELTSIEAAEIAVLPTEWHHLGPDQYRRFNAQCQRHGKRIAIFYNHDSCGKIGDSNAIIFRTSLRKADRAVNEFAIPAWSDDFLREAGGTVASRTYNTQPTISFCGFVPQDRMHVRTRAVEIVRRFTRARSNIVARDRFWGGLEASTAAVARAQAQRAEFVDSILESDYVLCVRGAGNFSYRLYETLCCGRIPVIVNTDCVLPFEETINWHSHALIVDETDLPNLEQRLIEFHGPLSPDEFEERQHANRRLWQSHLSPEGFFSQFANLTKAALATALSSSLEVRGDVRSEERRLRCLFVNTYYPQFLSEHYRTRPGMITASYQTQLQALLGTRFGDSDFYSRNLTENGWEAADVIANCAPIQMAWAREHGLPSNADSLQILIAQIQSFKPDVLYLQNLNIATEEFFARARPHARLIVGQVASPIPRHACLKQFDLVISSLWNMVLDLRRNGVKAEYVPLAFDPSVLSEIRDCRKLHPLTFVGSLSAAHEQRLSFLNILVAQTNLKLWGPTPPALPSLTSCYQGQTWGLQMFKVLASSSITINHHIDISGSFANNMRLYEATGCGALLITDYKDNLSEQFEIGKEVVAYRSPDECLALIRYYLRHPENAQEIAKAGQARTLKDHQYTQRLRDLSEMLKRELQRKQHACEIPSNGAPADPTSTTNGWQNSAIPLRQRQVVEEELSQLYEGHTPAVFQALIDAFQPLVFERPLVAELGCASGYYFEVLTYSVRHPFDYVGVDYSAPMLELAQKCYPRLNLVHADGAQLPFKNQHADVAISSCVLLHASNYAKHISETCRIVKRHVIAHRTPVCRERSTWSFEKLAYGVRVQEFRFNEAEILAEFEKQGFTLIRTIPLFSNASKDDYWFTYVFEKA